LTDIFAKSDGFGKHFIERTLSATSGRVPKPVIEHKKTKPMSCVYAALA
jgi:hypothetical protein